MELIETVLQSLLSQAQSETRVASFGKVTRWYPGVAGDPETPAVDVQPGVQEPANTIDGAVVFESLPVIPKVPVMFPQAGDRFGIDWELAPGDTVLLVFPAHEWSHWFVTGEPAPAHDDRPHSVGNAVAFPCGYSRGRAGATTVAGAMVIKAPEIRAGGVTATLKVAIASLVRAEIDRVIGAFNAHAHPYANGTTPATTSAIVAPLAVTSEVGSSVLKTKA